MFFYVLISVLSVLHPVHLTVTNVEFFSDKKVFVVQVRFFRDDLAKAIDLDTGIKPDFKQNTRENRKLLLDYLRRHLVIYVNGKDIVQSYALQGYELKDITLWARIRFRYKQQIKTVKIVNTLMLRLYPDQRNLLIFTYKGKQQGIQFNRRHTVEILNHL